MSTYILKLRDRNVELRFALHEIRQFCKFENIDLSELNHRLFFSHISDPRAAAIEMAKPVAERMPIAVDLNKFMDVTISLIRAGASRTYGMISEEDACDWIDEAGGINSSIWEDLMKAVAEYVLPKEEKKSAPTKKEKKESH